jgi:hypothetical protein
MNQDITFTTLLNDSWNTAETKIYEAKSEIRDLKRQLRIQEQWLESREREFEQLKRFYNDYTRPFDDVIVTEDTIANFEANLKAVVNGDRVNVDILKIAPVGTVIKVDIADIAQSIADDFIARLRAAAPVDTDDDGPTTGAPEGTNIANGGAA